MSDIPKCFADYCDDRRFVDHKFSCRANVQRESRSRPTENGLRISHHVDSTGTSQTTIPGLGSVAFASAMCKSPSASTCRAITRPVRAYQLFSRAMRSDCHVTRTSGPGQLNISDGVTA